MAQEMCGSVRVVVRCRPLLSGEEGDACSRVHFEAGGGNVLVDGKAQEGTRCFTFDRVLPPNSTQEDVMQEVSPMIEHVLKGIHATVFAYGQTGSGKTYTVEGIDYLRHGSGNPRPSLKTDPRQHGIIPRAIQLVFDRAREMQLEDGNLRFQFCCSFYQIYNERVTDLLNPATTHSPNAGLKVGWCRGDVFAVENLFICNCDEPEKMRRCFFSGTKEKFMGSHAMNQQSSRSHCVFTIYVARCDADSPETPIRAELSIVDLAGSERIAMLSRNPSSSMIKDSPDINASLLTLGRVITALAANGTRAKKGKPADRSHIPYRESKLTMLLKHALGGNSLTTMIACISPSDRYVDETLSTLLYAGRARNITNIPRVNEDAKSALIRQLRAEVASMKRELKYCGILTTDNLGKVDFTESKRLQERDGTDDGRVNELAEKLVQACEALKNIIAVNGQLRDAFDTVKNAKAELERRELELNAENLALRERIELLESIVLKEDFMGESTRDFDFAGIEENEWPCHALLDGPSLFGVDIGSSLKGVHNRPLSADLASPPRSSEKHVKRRDYITVIEDGDGRGPLFAPSSARTLSGSQRRGFSVTRNKRSANSRSDFVARKASPKERRRRQRSKIQKKLEEYTNRYCQPNHFVNYAEYYAKARQQIPVNHAAAVAIKEMEGTLKQLPRSIAATVPQSLKFSSEFGSLSFGGSREGLTELEQRRQQREAKRKALLAEQQALRDSVTRTLVNATEQLECLRYAGTGAVTSHPYSGDIAGRTKVSRTGAPSISSAPANCGMSRLRAYLDLDAAKRALVVSSPQ
ncbi:putative kinesin-like protein [Trypanosoma cruzi]|nr:putative kinesin-like protein [Trypanosoma cruzi]